MKESTEELPAGAFDGLAHVPLDDALDALHHTERRELLIALLDCDRQDGSLTVLADPADDADALERVIAVNRVHLSALTDYGFIDWNRATQEVTRGPNFDEIRPLLELVADREDELPDSWL